MLGEIARERHNGDERRTNSVVTRDYSSSSEDTLGRNTTGFLALLSSNRDGFRWLHESPEGEQRTEALHSGLVGDLPDRRVHVFPVSAESLQELRFLPRHRRTVVLQVHRGVSPVMFQLCVRGSLDLQRMMHRFYDPTGTAECSARDQPATIIPAIWERLV